MTASVLELARRLVADRKDHGDRISKSSARLTGKPVPRDTAKACPAGQASVERLEASVGTNGTAGTLGTPMRTASIGTVINFNDRDDCPALTQILPSSLPGGESSRAALDQALSRLPRPYTRDGSQLLQCSQDFLSSRLFDRARQLGWSNLELFGIAPHIDQAPRGGLGIGDNSCLQHGYRLEDSRYLRSGCDPNKS